MRLTGEARLGQHSVHSVHSTHRTTQRSAARTAQHSMWLHDCPCLTRTVLLPITLHTDTILFPGHESSATLPTQHTQTHTIHTDTIPTVEQLVHSHASFLSALGHESAHVIGHSYGSLVASRFVQLHPKAVVSLTLMDPVGAGSMR